MINLYLNPYKDSNKDRDREVQFCLNHNRQNKVFTKVYELPNRPTYREYFKFANSVTHKDEINIICNADIFFDNTIRYAEMISEKEVYAITRWDVVSINPLKANLLKIIGSQDTWIWKGFIREKDINYCDFELGKMGCDNRIAWEFNNAGYRVLNPCHSIKTYHYHLTNIHNYNINDRTKENVVQPPHMMVRHTDLPARITEFYNKL